MTDKTSKEPLNEIEDPTKKYYEPKPEGEKRFWKMHIIAKHLDRVGNGDNVYSGTNVDKDHTRPADKGRLDIPPHDSLKESARRVTENFVSKLPDLKKKESLAESENGATSDNPAQGDTSPKVGGIDHQDNLDKDNDNPSNEAKRALETIALQTAEMFDMIKPETKLASWAQDKLNIAEGNLAELYSHIMDRANLNAESADGIKMLLAKRKQDQLHRIMDKKAAKKSSIKEEKESKSKVIKGFEVGTIVKPMVGPHKGQNHRVIHVFPHSDSSEPRYNIAPINAKNIKYKLGAASCYHSQLHEAVAPLTEAQKDYKAKAVSGLYTHSHFEHPNGSFVQIHNALPFSAIHQDQHGKRTKFHKYEDLKKHLSGLSEEYLDELSKKTVISYLGKSGHQSDELRARSQSFPGTMSSAKSLLTPDEEKTRQKRLNGQWSGVSRLTTNKYKKYTTEEDNEFDPEDVELLEVITSKTSVGDTIHDFVHSDNAKFSGDSKKQRIRRALGAWYGMHKEEFAALDEMTKGRILQAIDKGFKTYRATADPSQPIADNPTIKKINRVYDHLKKRTQSGEPHLLKVHAEEQDLTYGGGMSLKPDTGATTNAAPRGKKKTAVKENTFVPFNDGGNQNNSGADLQNDPQPYNGANQTLTPENPRTKQRRWKRQKVYLKPAQKPVQGKQTMDSIKLTTEENNDVVVPGRTTLNARSNNKKVIAKPLDTEETLHEVNVGDHVHLGFGSRGGAGYRGKVTKIEGQTVHVQSHEEGKFGPRTFKGPLRFVTKEEVQVEGTHRYNSFGQWSPKRVHPAGHSSDSGDARKERIAADAKLVNDALAGKNTRTERDKKWRAQQDAAWEAKKNSQKEEVEVVEGVKETIKGAVRRFKSKDHFAQNRSDVAHDRAADAFSSGNKRNGTRYMNFVIRDRNKHGYVGLPGQRVNSTSKLPSRN